MELLPLHITALAPLAFPPRKPGTQFRASLPYVPGTAMYGALGMHMGAQGTFESQLFRDIRCHNAYPAYADDPWVRPLPMTAIQPKGAADDTPPVDALVSRACWERQQPAALIYAPTDDDGRPWEAAGATFYTLKNGKIEQRSVTQRTLTRVAINRRRGTAEDQRLYSLLALNEVTEQQPTRFCGSLVCPTGKAIEMQAALEALTHLGARQTTGLGAVQVTLSAGVHTFEPVAEIQRRVQAMTTRFQQQAALYEKLGGAPWPITAETIFTVNLLSDAILLAQGWVPTHELSADMLAEATGIKAHLIRAFTTTSIVGGWNVSWQRPKASDVAVTMGSLFVFQADGPLNHDQYRALTQLQLDGIGERRAEGYGQIRICDEFHLMEMEQNR